MLPFVYVLVRVWSTFCV